MLSKLLLLTTTVCIALLASAQSQSVAFGFHSTIPKDGFVIEVQRSKKHNGLIEGMIYLNNDNLGVTYENASLEIPAGDYPGFLIYASGGGHAQGPLGQLAEEGDFLIEIGKVPNRAHILFHGGNKPHQSKGCILLGSVRRDPSTGVGQIRDDHPLRVMRTRFYGQEFPTQTPAKNIMVRIIENY